MAPTVDLRIKTREEKTADFPSEQWTAYRSVSYADLITWILLSPDCQQKQTFVKYTLWRHKVAVTQFGIAATVCIYALLCTSSTCHHGHNRHAWSLRLQACISLDRWRAVARLVEALRDNPEGRGFDSRLCHWNFSWYSPTGRTVALGMTQCLTEQSARNISWGVKAAGA